MPTFLLVNNNLEREVKSIYQINISKLVLVDDYFHTAHGNNKTFCKKFLYPFYKKRRLENKIKLQTTQNIYYRDC